MLSGGPLGWIAAAISSLIRADYGDSARVRIRTITLLGAIAKVTVTRV